MINFTVTKFLINQTFITTHKCNTTGFKYDQNLIRYNSMTNRSLPGPSESVRYTLLATIGQSQESQPKTGPITRFCNVPGL